MADLPPHLYIQRGIARGHPAEVVARASAHRSELISRGLVPIISLGHLAQLTGASYTYLREIVQRTRDPYIQITRPKADGSSRELSSPELPLMEVQRWILRNVLKLAKIHPSSFAYRANRSASMCAAEHLGARWLVKMDLHNFFDGIDEARVYRVFVQLGYRPLVSLELSRICTRLPFPLLPSGRQRTRYHAIPFYATRGKGRLPQGAPTSGALANSVAYELDQKLSQLAAARSLSYTRYSDDMTFSSAADFNRGHAASVIAHVSNVIRDEHFIVHKKKTRVIPPGARHVVLGLMLGPDGLRLLPEYRRRVEVHIRGADVFGLAQHCAHRGFRSIFSFINYMDGCLAFAQSIEPEYAHEARQRWNRALIKSGFPADER